MTTPEQTLMPGVTLHTFGDPVTMARGLAVAVADQLAIAIRDRGRGLLVVSGGRTPAGFLGCLSTMDVDWRQVDVVSADERWAPADSDQRNSLMIRQSLLQGDAGQARFHELIANDATSPAQAATGANERLLRLGWPADVVVLGMGADGHVASLFPDAPELAQGLAGEGPLVLTMTPPSQDRVRLSLSARALAGAGLTVLLMQGADKRRALDAAVADPLAVQARPIRYFFRQPLRVFWSP